MPAADPIRKKDHLKQMAGYFLRRAEPRNYVLLIVGVHTALRISDLLRLTWEDVYDEESGRFRDHVTVTEKKTAKPKTFALNRQVKKALALYYPHRRGPFLFPNNRRNMAAISRVQAYRIIRSAADALGIAGTISCHSLRKTFGYHAWNSGVSAVVLMDIYNHTSYAVTKRYLGISQDDRDRVYLGMALF